MPDVIQQPNLGEMFAGAFMHGFTTMRQLANERQKLELERQRTASQVNMQGAEAGEARARTAGLEQGIEANENKMAGLRFAMSQAGADDATFAKNLTAASLDPDVAAQAGLARQDMTQRAADLNKTNQEAAANQELVAQRQQQVAAAIRDQQEDQRIGQLVGTFDPTQLRTQGGLNTLASRIAMINPAKVKGIVDAFHGDFSFHNLGTDGYLVNTRTGAWQRIPGNFTNKMTSAQQGRQASALIALQAMDALQGNISTGGYGAVEYPTKASTLSALADWRVAGGHPFKGIAGPLSLQTMSGVQQQSQALYSKFVHGLAGTMGGYRSMALMNSMLLAYQPRAGQSRSATISNVRSMTGLRQFLLAIAQGQPVDVTQMPGFDQWSKDAAQTLGGEPSEEPDDPSQLPMQDYLQGVPQP